MITFRSAYAFSERFVLPLSHDEVVHGKGSLLGKMPGDDWQRRANLRLLLAWQWATPGKKLLFMGSEIGQPTEWAHDGSVEWHLLQYPEHQGIQRWVTDLNHLYSSEPALHELDFDPAGFSWIDANDTENSVVSLLRRGRSADDILVAVTRWTVRLKEKGWGNTVVPLPDGTWKDALTGAIADGPTSAAQLFADLPVVLLERHHD